MSYAPTKMEATGIKYNTIRKVQENKVGVKLNGTHYLLVYAVDDDESTG
jgi:hypothetical protein